MRSAEKVLWRSRIPNKPQSQSRHKEKKDNLEMRLRLLATRHFFLPLEREGIGDFAEDGRSAGTGGGRNV
jgi:hypothetical protein